MRTVSWRRLTLPLALLITMPALAAQGPATAAPERAGVTSELAEPEQLLAVLNYTNGVAAEFTYGLESQDFGLVQAGEVDANSPVVRDGGESLLESYLEITPHTVPVPRLLIQSHPDGQPLPRELSSRTLSDETVRVKGLTAPLQAQSTQGCWDLYWNTYHWFDVAAYPSPNQDTTAAKTYYASQVGNGKMKQYAYSYVANCSSIGVRHRVYYKSGGEYFKHFDKEVGFFKWNAVKRGSVLRWRKVVYNASLSYTRSGRFMNT